MTPGQTTLLLVSVAALLQGGTSRSALDILRELKNRIFIPNNVPPPTQKPESECSDLDEVNETYFQQSSAVSKAFNMSEIPHTTLTITKTVENELNAQENTSNSEFNADLTEASREYITNETNESENIYAANFTQYYDEVRWNGTDINGTALYEGLDDDENELGYLENGQNETTYTDDKSFTPLNEITTSGKGQRRRRDMTDGFNEAYNGSKPLNTTFFTSEAENSRPNTTIKEFNTLIENSQGVLDDLKTSKNESTKNYTVLSNQVFRDTENESEQEINIIDSNNINETNSMSETKYMSEIIQHDEENKTVAIATNLTVLQAEPSRNESTCIIDTKETDLNYTQLYNEVFDNTSQPLESCLTNTTYVGLNNTTDTDTKNEISLQNTTECGDHDDFNSTGNDIVATHCDTTSNNSISINTSQAPVSIVINNKNETTTDQTIYMPETMLGDHVTNALKTNLTTIEKVIINSTKTIEEFFHNITQDLPTDFQVTGNTSIPFEEVTHETKLPIGESKNFSMEIIESIAMENKINNQNETENDTETKNLNQNEKSTNMSESYEMNETSSENTTAFEDKPLGAVNLTNGDEGTITMDDTVLLHPESTGGGGSQFDYVVNRTETGVNVTQETIPHIDRKRRSLTLTIEKDDEAAAIKTSTMEEEVTTRQADETTKPCTNSTECCQHLECVASTGENSTQYCDVLPTDPPLPTPLPDTREPQEVQL